MIKQLFILIFLLAPLSLHASTYYINSRLQTQIHENALSEQSAPFDAYLDTGLAGLPNSGSIDVSLKNNYLINNNINDKNNFDLYQAVFRMNRIKDFVDLSAGRQIVSPGFHVYLLDGLSTKIGKSDWPILITLLGGIPRYIETGDFHGQTGLVAGTTLELSGIENLNAKISAVYDKLDIKNHEWNRSDTILVGMASSYEFDVSMSPYIYDNFEYDTAGNNIDTGILGFSFEPTKKIYFNIEGGHYNTNRDRRRPTIFALYTSGAFYQGRTGVAVDVLDNLRVSGGYAYQRATVTPSLKKHGHVADAGIQFTIEPINLDTGVAYRFLDSFGGRAHDILVEFHNEPVSILSIDLGGNYTRYSKITNAENTAISSFLTAGVEAVKNLVISAGGEYLRNNTFKNEWRAMAKVAYRLEGSL